MKEGVAERLRSKRSAPRQRRALSVGLVGTVVALLLFASPASAADFMPGPGTYTANTTLELRDPGGAVVATGVARGGVAVFSFDNVTIPAGTTLNVRGSRPFELRASGRLTLRGTIDGSGVSATDFVAGPNEGGPAGGAGGADGTEGGDGPGGGGTGTDTDDGGGGGRFGGRGARGGVGTLVSAGGSGGAGGPPYGDLRSALEGGSGGAGGTDPFTSVPAGGGGGGGAIQLTGDRVTIAASGSVRVDGGGGAAGGFGASAGGSGGGIILRGKTITVNGTLSARGGDGGAGGCCGDGGGGGGGRIAYQFGTLTSPGTTDVDGGESGVRSTSGIGVLSGNPSPDPTGAQGVVTRTRLPQCSDGRDNDRDGRTDHPRDPGCSSANDASESPDPMPPPPPPDRCTITRGSGNDVIRGTPGDDVICAGAGNDIVYGRG